MSRVLVIGCGARENALCWALSSSPDVSTVFVMPGNAGTSLLDKSEMNIVLEDLETVEWCLNNEVDMVVVGPELKLSGGIADDLIENGIPCFGPTKAAARIESDKVWSKEFMNKHGIPTAEWTFFVDANEAKDYVKLKQFETIVIKASGLANGKGVIIAHNEKEAVKAIDDLMVQRKFGAAGDKIIVEDFLSGEEISVMAFSDGKHISVMPPVQDHKRLFNEDKGPNTGGMGAYCPAMLTENQKEFVKECILQKVVNAMREEGHKFIGVLYAGLMVTTDEIKVLEFNCRLGDPETQVLLPLLHTDLYRILLACCCGDLNACPVLWKDNLYACGVVLASEGYPDNVVTGDVISNLSVVNGMHGCIIFHAGTIHSENGIKTNGGRVLTTVAMGKNLIDASAKATTVASLICFRGKQYRTDIAHKGIAKYILSQGNGSYKSAGVDVNSGNDFVKSIKTGVEDTFTPMILSPLGSFGAVIDANLKSYKDPLFVTGTDGVGTKLKIAQECGIHDTVGEDLVAMCVNDVIAHGAKPLFFLDYIACGVLECGIAMNVMQGIINGCKKSGCSLVGGETAEMPGFYKKGEYDLAGFVVGVVEKENLLPIQDDIRVGDKVIYLPSSGIHSNGFSLIRKIMSDFELAYGDASPFLENETFGNFFLKPTYIYVDQVLNLTANKRIKAFAHITGGGLMENIPRILPKQLAVVLNAYKWEIHPVFAWIAAMGKVKEEEMLSTFNCGIGGIVIVSPENEEYVRNFLNSNTIGTVCIRDPDDVPVKVLKFSEKLIPMMNPYVKILVDKRLFLSLKKRVAVLISGKGTNLQALIKAFSNKEDTNIEIALVISSKSNAKGIEIAKRHEIPVEVILHSKNKNEGNRDDFLTLTLKDYGIDIMCLAGYMQILSEAFVQLWRGKILNVHPSLLPSFKGMHAQHQALIAGVKITGCTVHFVEAAVDSGAIIEQKSVPIFPNDTVETLTERIKEVEHEIFPKVLQMVACGKVTLDLNSSKLIWK